MISETLIPEFDHEIKTTRNVLERVDWEKKDWKPHEKSMTFGGLAAHVAEIGMWCISTLNTSGIDMEKNPYFPPAFSSLEELLKDFDSKIKEGRALLEKTSDEAFMETWTMKAGEKVFMSMPRIAAYRSIVIKHTVHHRGQLSVYLRMNDIPVPSIYGPSADEAAL